MPKQEFTLRWRQDLQMVVGVRIPSNALQLQGTGFEQEALAEIQLAFDRRAVSLMVGSGCYHLVP